MPFVNFMLSPTISEEAAARVKKRTAELIQEHAGKDEGWLFVRLEGDQLLFFKGQKLGAGGVVEVKLVGSLEPDQKRHIVKDLSALLSQELGIGAASIYVIFTEVRGEDWGWNNGTFG